MCGVRAIPLVRGVGCNMTPGNWAPAFLHLAISLLSNLETPSLPTVCLWFSPQNKVVFQTEDASIPSAMPEALVGQ